MVRKIIYVFVGTFVQISASITKIRAEEITVNSLDQHVESEVTAVQIHLGVRHPGCGDPGGAENLAHDCFTEECRILPGIIQQEFLLAMKSLVRIEFVELNGECGFSFQWFKTSMPL